MAENGILTVNVTGVEEVKQAVERLDHRRAVLWAALKNVVTAYDVGSPDMGAWVEAARKALAESEGLDGPVRPHAR